MNIKIRRLTPDLVEAYVHFFETTPHWYDSDKRKCYCIPYCNDDYEEIKSIVTSQEAIRNYTIDCIKKNKLQGYLAFDDDKIVGWCNANTKGDCLMCNGWQNNLKFVPTEDIATYKKVKSIFCFVIAPEMRRKGIAKKLLEKICEDAKTDGFDYVEAYPEKQFLNECDSYQGPITLFEKCGFSIYAEADNKLVMRKVF